LVPHLLRAKLLLLLLHLLRAKLLPKVMIRRIRRASKD
jgi:hypothetical protein